jgi:deoxyadenosine/deoxycytidine kinase
MTKITIISIEGNIGSGKSTLLEKIRDTYKNINTDKDIVFLKEPVDDWESICDKEGNTMLKKFYNNQEKYSFAFQMMAYISRLALIKTTVDQKNPKKDLFILTERSLFTDKYVFAKMLYDSEKIEEVEYQIYIKWFDCFVKDFPVNKIVYVNSSPEICHERILKRGRDGEDGIPIEYLVNCHNYHEMMLKENVNCESIILDGNIDTTKSRDQIEKWVNEINNFISI